METIRSSLNHPGFWNGSSNMGYHSVWTVQKIFTNALEKADINKSVKTTMIYIHVADPIGKRLYPPPKQTEYGQEPIN